MANAHRLVCYKSLCQNKFLHKEVIIRNSILGHKFQHNVLIMREGNIQCFVVSPVNDNSSGLEREFTGKLGLAVVTHLFSKIVEQFSRELSSSEALLLSLTYCFLHAFFFFFCVHLSLISFGFFLSTQSGHRDTKLCLEECSVNLQT